MMQKSESIRMHIKYKFSRLLVDALHAPVESSCAVAEINDDDDASVKLRLVLLFIHSRKADIRV